METPEDREPTQPPAAASAESPVPSPSVVASETSPLRQFLGLFVVPLVVVLLCIGVFIGFGWIAYDQRDTSDYLGDLRSGWGPRRRQAAYELSRILVADPQALASEPGVGADVRRIFRETEDESVRQYLALVLGFVGDREALGDLAAALDGSDPQTRVYAVVALGNIGDPAALPKLLELLSDDDPGIRKTAAHAIGGLGEKSAAARLEPLLADSTADVRWNAALALARLGSPAAVPVLERMLDRRLIGQVPDITAAQQEDAMVEAVPALTVLTGNAARATLEPLAESDPSLKVRQAAIEALAVLDVGPPAAAADPAAAAAASSAAA